MGEGEVHAEIAFPGTSDPLGHSIVKAPVLRTGPLAANHSVDE